MTPEMPGSALQLVLGVAVPILLGTFALYLMLVRTRDRRIAELESAAADARQQLVEARREVAEYRDRSQYQTQAIAALQRTILYIPEIAQRLAGCLDQGEVPAAALDLADEILDPEFSVFYRARRGQIVAVECRGNSPYPVGHRVAVGEGVVGWTASRQIAFTEDDARRESVLVRSDHLSKCYPPNGFSICAPLVIRDETLGVVLLGPLRRPEPQLRELARTIALIASVSIESAVMFKREQTLAQIDGLTGILNKSNILHRARAIVDGREGHHSQLAVFLIDIDHFKRFNDTNGHLNGDELLKEISALLGQHARDGEFVGRFGGEEFLILMPGTPRSEAVRAADRFRELVADTVFIRGSDPSGRRVTISGGVAMWPSDGPDVESVLQVADDALYEAKRSGRNRIVAHQRDELREVSESDFFFGESHTDLSGKPDPPDFDYEA